MNMVRVARGDGRGRAQDKDDAHGLGKVNDQVHEMIREWN